MSRGDVSKMIVVPSEQSYGGTLTFFGMKMVPFNDTETLEQNFMS